MVLPFFALVSPISFFGASVRFAARTRAIFHFKFFVGANPTSRSVRVRNAAVNHMRAVDFFGKVEKRKCGGDGPPRKARAKAAGPKTPALRLNLRQRQREIL
jgi:hypothetical protein